MKKSVPFDISELHYLFHPRFNPNKSRKLLNFDSPKEAPAKSLKPRLVVRPKKFPKIKDPTEIVCSKRKTGDLLDRLIADRIASEILSRQNALQKMKDRDTLKTWRDKYRRDRSNGVPPIFVKNPPPYGFDEDLLSMTSRLELKDSKPKHKRERRSESDINEEIAELKNLLDSLKTKRNSEEPLKNMASALEEIKAIKSIQEKLRILKRKC